MNPRDCAEDEVLTAEAALLPEGESLFKTGGIPR